MQPINEIRSFAVPLPLPNIDTDQIIPKQFLKRIERTGDGEFLFYDWRRIQEGPDTGKPDPNFVLNRPEYAGAKILIAEKNFGCGSSRASRKTKCKRSSTAAQKIRSTRSPSTSKPKPSPTTKASTPNSKSTPSANTACSTGSTT